MWVSEVILEGIRCFKEETVTMSKGINVFVGENNSGKSTILHAIRLMQDLDALRPSDKRIGSSQGIVTISLEEPEQRYFNGNNKIKFVLRNRQLLRIQPNGQQSGTEPTSDTEPDNFIYPYLSKRKVAGYAVTVGSQSTNAITGDLSNLYAKVDRLTSPAMPVHDEYLEACERVLGFSVLAADVPEVGSGKKACYTVSKENKIVVDDMGEGIPNVLGLIVRLCYADPNKLFLIEEPENDLHPKALKELMKLIITKSEVQQFVITTHSNMVVRYLGSVEKSKIFEVTPREKEQNVFTSAVKEISRSIGDRRELLERLGYESVDFEKWEGWLFLEESSAEKVIRDHLIQWFIPSMKERLRTYSAQSLNRVHECFDDFIKIFCFFDLEPVYKNKVWVIVDNGEPERKVIKELKEAYVQKGWDEGQFMHFEQTDFERYYPEEFKERVEKVLGYPHGPNKQEEKKLLLEDVDSWIKEDDERAKKAFEISAAEVIDKLKVIEGVLRKQD